MKETSFLSYDLLRECKYDSSADKEEHIATLCLIVSDTMTVLIVLCAHHWENRIYGFEENIKAYTGWLWSLSLFMKSQAQKLKDGNCSVALKGHEMKTWHESSLVLLQCRMTLFYVQLIVQFKKIHLIIVEIK